MNTGPPIAKKRHGAGMLITESSAGETSAAPAPEFLSFHMKKRMTPRREIHSCGFRGSGFDKGGKRGAANRANDANARKVFAIIRVSCVTRGAIRYSTITVAASTPSAAPASWNVARAINLPDESMISTRVILTAGLTEIGKAAGGGALLE